MGDIARIAVAIAVGAAGGALFYALSLPLPWMLGALTATMMASLAGLRMQGPVRVRAAVVAVIGVLLGANFTPDLLSHALDWAVSLVLLAVYLLASILLVMPWYQRVGGFDAVTAYFAGMPGGLSEMIELGEAAGADVPRIILAQSLRIVTTIALIAIWFRWVQGYDVGRNAVQGGFADISWTDLGLLALAALLGSWLGLRLRLPAPTLLGPMIISAALHLTDLTRSAPPVEIVIAAQVILGTVLGCRFQGLRASALVPAVGLSLGATLIILSLALGFALMIEAATGQSAEQVLLAYAPGGLTEMSLIAIALHAEVAFVALHHVVRILLVILAAPLAFRRWKG